MEKLTIESKTIHKFWDKENLLLTIEVDGKGNVKIYQDDCYPIILNPAICSDIGYLLNKISEQFGYTGKVERI